MSGKTTHQNVPEVNSEASLGCDNLKLNIYKKENGRGQKKKRRSKRKKGGGGTREEKEEEDERERLSVDKCSENQKVTHVMR